MGTIKMFLFILMLTGDEAVHAVQGECSSVVNNTLSSPGYPNNYPNNMDCHYKVSIPEGMVVKNSFDYFNLQNGYPCMYDYVKITNEVNETFGVFCGIKTGWAVYVDGDYVMITFHSNNSTQGKGFLISFTTVPKAPPRLLVTDPVVAALPGHILWCVATGTPPMYTALIRNNLLLANRTRRLGIRLYVENNYTCVATNRFGTDLRKHRVILVACGSVVNNVLKSPGYPYNYANNMDCSYSVPIAQGMLMRIDFHEFYLEDHSLCGRDHLTITNEMNEPFGVFCGRKIGKTVIVTGKYVMLSFHSDRVVQKRGFLLYFTAFFPAPPKIMLPTSVVRALPDYRVSCLVSGTPPIYTALIKNSTVLVNTTNIAAARDAGNYTCMATNKYGTDLKDFSIVFLDCGPNCSSKWDITQGNILRCRTVTSLFAIIKCSPTITHEMELSESSNITFLPDGAFGSFIYLRILDLKSNAIALLSEKAFANLTNLIYLYLSRNAITFLPEGVFSYLPGLKLLEMDYNAIEILPQRVFANLTNLTILEISQNNISFLPDGVFDNQPNLRYLALSGNHITHLPKRIFAALNMLRALNLHENNLQNLTKDVFPFPASLTYLFLGGNKFQNLTSDVFSGLVNLQVLGLNSNGLKNLPGDVFSALTKLRIIDLSNNKLQHFETDLFCCSNELRYLYLQSNTITSISKETFPTANFLYIFLGFNRLESISYRTFFNMKQVGLDDEVIMLTDNPIRMIESEAFRIGGPRLEIYLLRTELKKLSLDSFVGVGGLDFKLITTDRMTGTLEYYSRRPSRSRCTIYVTPVHTDTAAIRVDSPVALSAIAVTNALIAAGFTVIYSNATSSYILPCPAGTFSNSSNLGRLGCEPCTPGGFYSDDVGYVATNCKKCPNGSFVAYDKAPGTQTRDCKSCPLGTETDFFAGYRACECLEGYYRTHMFEQCYKCGEGGLRCQDDYASLKPGYWWEWRNDTYKHRYRKYIDNLMEALPKLGREDVQFPYPVPAPYMCPTKESCMGGLDSKCVVGYEGPLCAVCSSAYYKQLQTCTRCPSKKWLVGQLVIIVVTLLIIMAVVLWRTKRKQKERSRAVIDMFFSKLKIIIGFYQVTYGLLEAFSYIEWPESMQVIGKYSSLLQMNFLQITPVNCLYSGFHVNAFTSLFVTMAINAAVIVFSGIAYGMHKVVILRNSHLEDEEKSNKISLAKELVYRQVFFFLYVTYLSTCAKTVSVLPPACRKLCRDEKEEICNKYLKADYSIRCQGPNYNNLLIVAYISTAYIIILPTAAFITLWRQRKVMFGPLVPKVSPNSVSSMELIIGLSFLFENYNTCSWYWELIEMSRKVILTSGLILVGQESRSYIGLALVIAGMYGMLFAWIKPIRDTSENRLMSASLAVTIVNLAVGAVSKIPAENITDSSDPFMDAVVWNILVLIANTLVVGLVVVQYTVSLYTRFKEWRKNPQWSLSCCLAVILPLSDLQGEINSFAEADVLTNQPLTENEQNPNSFTAVSESVVINVNLEQGNKHHVGNIVEGGVGRSGGTDMAEGDKGEQADVGGDRSNNSTSKGEKTAKKCNQGTQTELLMPLVTARDFSNGSIKKADI